MWFPRTPPHARWQSGLVPTLPLPPTARVGLLGGSFDPAHEGHLHISRHALLRFGLDAVVWLVSPGNPLKSRKPATLAQRVARAEALTRAHRRILVSDFEARVNARYTADTLELLRFRHRHMRFVWLMGADNLGQFHQWKHWQHIMNSVPIGTLARPGQRLSARRSKTAQIYAAARLPARAAPLLADMPAPAWCFVNLPMVRLSSSGIRASGRWPNTVE